MSDYTRFAVYYLPPLGPLTEFGAQWLGWNIDTGSAVAHFDIPDLDVFTQTPRKYGFHGTLKPPFRLADGMTLDGLRHAVATLAKTQPAVQIDGLTPIKLGRFWALAPVGDTADLAHLATRIVQDLDGFRAPSTPEDLERRRKANLTLEQVAHLQKWGYPYVLDQFKFHLTLTGKLSKPQSRLAEAALADTLPSLPQPYPINTIALVGERSDGQFETLHRYDLTGQNNGAKSSV
ncbi:DUF1045 domain-containing protein [uncultured Pelagimonas sp.]|uniref:DUF1045 domain-containing protein n=1 Tax=uncultured Pelagimonas sp. TaxID=1618102 RepID=UPI00261ABF19|nr:DUF1045 domain-containing protein [uncultured Pelagimonas sp.]